MPRSVGAAGGLKVGAAGTVKPLGIAGGLKLGIAGGLKLGIVGGFQLGIAGGFQLGAVGALKLGSGGALKLGCGGALKLGSGGTLNVGAAGGVRPLGTPEALGAAVVVGAGCVSVDDGAGIASPVDAGTDGSALATAGLVLVGAASDGDPPVICELATGWFVAAGCAALLVDAGGFLGVFAAVAGCFDPVLLLLGAPGD